MSAEEEEPIIPKSRRVNDAIAPKRLNQVLFLNKKEIKTKTIFQTSWTQDLEQRGELSKKSENSIWPIFMKILNFLQFLHRFSAQITIVHQMLTR